MNSPEKRPDQPGIDPREQDLLRAGRRAAILNGLGKGSAALAAMSPLASQASRSHKLFNRNFGTGGADCYCTVSGFQSAAISQVPSVTCGTFLPTHFQRKLNLTLNYVNKTNNSQSTTYDGITILTGNGPSDLAACLNTYFGLAQGTITLSQAQDFLNAHTAITTSGTGNLVKVIWTSATMCAAYQGKNFGSDNALASFSTLFGGSDERTLLEVLADNTTAKRYFLACYLSIGKSGISVPADLTRSYITQNYSDTIANNLTSNESLFFKAISNLA